VRIYLYSTHVKPNMIGLELEFRSSKQRDIVSAYIRMPYPQWVGAFGNNLILLQSIK